MYASSTQVHQAFIQQFPHQNDHVQPSAHPNAFQTVIHQQPSPQPQPQPTRAQPQQPAPKDPITVVAVPAVSIQANKLVVGNSQSSSTRSYTPLKVLGDGSFGTVWLCDWHGTLPPNTPLSPMQCGAGARPEWVGKRLVAVKRMKKKWEGGWDECKKLKELESLRAIPFHPNIIPLYDFFLLPASKELYFVFESMEGNLYHLIKARKGRPLAGGLVSLIFRQIVCGLDHIHSHGYFHRDMKPENVLVTTTGLFDYQSVSPIAPPNAPTERDVVAIIKLADFGLARETKSEPPYTEYVSTRWYRAPEVLLLSRDYSNPVDMWALGTIMAELVNLRPLFPGSGQIEQIHRICEILGDPSDEYGADSRGKPFGGGKWSKGTRMAKAVGFTFPKIKPRDIYSLFERSVPRSLIDCINDLLRYDPLTRLTSRQCLEHPYLLDTIPRNNIPLPNGLHLAPLPLIAKLRQKRTPSPPRPTPPPQPPPPPVPPLPLYIHAPAPHLHIPNVSLSHRTPFYPETPTTISPTPSPAPQPSGYANDVHVPHSVLDIPAVSLDRPAQSEPWARPADGDYDHPMEVLVQPNAPDRQLGQVMDTQDSHVLLSRPRADTEAMQASAHVANEQHTVNGHIPNGHIPNGHVPNGHVPNGHLSNGHIINGHDVAQPQGTKLGKFGVLTFGKKQNKWAFGGMFGHGDKPQHSTLPPVDEISIVGTTNMHSLKRTQSSSTDSRSLSETTPLEVARPVDAKKMKKEAERVHREAEKQRRALAERTQREQARAVMQKRNQMLQTTTTSNELEWKWQTSASLISTNSNNRPTIIEPVAKGKAATRSVRQNQAASTNGMTPATANIAAVRLPTQAVGAKDERRRDERVPKARRREFDDDHSMSSSDVHSLGRLSSTSFNTDHSDPGPRGRHRIGLFPMSRMTSTSSLRTSFDDFSPSSRSSNSFSLEQQLANDFHNHASMDPASPLSGSASPPPMQTLSISPSLSPPPHWIKHPNDNNSPRLRSQHLTHVAMPTSLSHYPSHMSPSGTSSSYEVGSQLSASPSTLCHPPSPGYAPKSAINPIFKVPPLPLSNGDCLPSTLPPFSCMEAVAEREYAPLSPIQFSPTEEDGP